MAQARRFRPTFDATITFTSDIEQRAGTKGPYAIARASIVTSDGQPRDRTVMVFGDALVKTRGLLHKSAKVRLAVQMDGGTVLVMGPPKKSQDDMTEACMAAAGFAEHATYGM